MRLLICLPSRPHLLAPALVLMSCMHVSAQPAPVLTNAAPAYLQRGQSIELTLAGRELADAQSAVIAGEPGLTAELIKPDKPTDDKAAAASQARVKITATADAELGTREMRLITTGGVTAPVPVTVGQYAPLAEVADAAPASPQSLAFPVSLAGKTEAAGDIDRYRFEAAKGQTVIFDVYASRISSKLEPVVLIFDAAGRELPAKVSHRDSDPVIAFEAPADGSYFMEVRDLQYRGGGEFAYRIEAGQIPYVQSILPVTAQRGGKVEVKAIGHNLAGGETILLDLTDANPGPMKLRAKTKAGLSNEVTFIVGDVSHATEVEPNDAKEAATLVALPSAVSGTLGKAGDEDFFRFNVAKKQSVSIEVQARRTGSPVDALLTLRDAKGGEIEVTNGTADAEARIARSLDPGDYIVSVRDLTFAGGPSYAYRVNVFQAGGAPPDFAVRFMPDAARVYRGSHSKLWCEVVRINGYKGDVTVELEGLPPGVAASAPVVLAENTSGIFTITAAGDAKVGSYPVRLKATGVVGASQAVRYADAELNNRTVQQAYVTVLDAAPYTVEAVALLTGDRLKQYPKDIEQLVATLDKQTPELDAAQAKWEKAVAGGVEWKPLEFAQIESKEGVTFTKQSDGSYLASGNNPAKDTVTLTAHVDLKGITGVRLEALPDKSLPHDGPGRHGDNGNFLLSRFAVTAQPKADKPDPAKGKPVALVSPRATYEQVGFTLESALDDKPDGGWAIQGGTGKAQMATAFVPKPLGGDGGTTLIFTLDQQRGENHTLGRFRLSVTTDADALAREKRPVPAPILAIIKAPADKRTPEQKAQLAAYYRATGPELAADRAKLEALRNAVGPYAEIARLEAVLDAQTPALDAERTRWEQTVLSGGGWVPLDVTEMTAGGAVLTKEADGSMFAGGYNAPTERYTLNCSTTLKSVAAIKIEALPDERLPGSGPGRGKDGNFILTKLAVAAAPRPAASATMAAPPANADAGRPPPPTLLPPRTPPAPVALSRATADVEQNGWTSGGAIDDRNETGWGIAPTFGRPATAIFTPAAPITGEGGLVLNLTLEFNAPQPQFAQHSLGRFRLWVTGADNPAAGDNVPESIVEILRVPANTRNPQLRQELDAYYRSIAPSLDPVRRRLAELRGRVTPLPITVARGRSATIAVPVNRTGDFKGDVTVTLEGFVSGRDANTRLPTAIGKSLVITPMTVDADDSFGRLTLRANNNSELGTRMVVLKADTRVGGETITQYSPAFPLTVTER